MADTTTTFAGIHNENEFYSQHCLSEIFTGDIRDTIARWREAAEAAGGPSAGARTPNEALRTLARDYLQFRRQFAHERQHAKRGERQRTWFGQLLGALGYEHAPHNHVLDDGDEVPVLFAGRQHGEPRCERDRFLRSEHHLSRYSGFIARLEEISSGYTGLSTNGSQCRCLQSRMAGHRQWGHASIAIHASHGDVVAFSYDLETE